MIRTSSRRTVGLTQADLLAILAVGLFGLGLLLPVAVRAAKLDGRKICAQRLHWIGQAMLLYANENKRAFPRGRYDPDAADKLTAFAGAQGNDPLAADAPVNDVTVPLYLLLRTEDVASLSFVCPETRDAPLAFRRTGPGERTPEPQNVDAERENQLRNFPRPDALSYSMANPYPDKAAAGAGYRLHAGLDPAFALLADLNPGAAATRVAKDSAPDVVKAGNSPNHRGQGQNVMYGDLHVEWQETPLCGKDGDNIYTRANPAGGDPVVGSPVSADDSVLLPTVAMREVKR